MARDTLVAIYLAERERSAARFGLDGSPRGEIPLPGIGSIVSIDARAGTTTRCGSSSLVHASRRRRDLFREGGIC